MALDDERHGERLRHALAAVYKAALIDEFQDTDPIQYAIFDAIFDGEAPLFLIGDPKQAIYRFRGADIYAYLAASRAAKQRFTLSTSYRSDRKLLDSINTLFGDHRNPFALAPVRYRRVKPGITDDAAALYLDGERATPFVLWLQERGDAASVAPLNATEARHGILRAVAREIAALVHAGREGRARIGQRALRPSDIAILVRTNGEAAAAREALAAVRVPAVLYRSGSVFTTFEAFELESCSPRSPSLYEANFSGRRLPHLFSDSRSTR